MLPEEFRTVSTLVQRLIVFWDHLNTARDDGAADASSKCAVMSERRFDPGHMIQRVCQDVHTAVILV